jgi:hypothetical protein
MRIFTIATAIFRVRDMRGNRSVRGDGSNGCHASNRRRQRTKASALRVE